MKKGIDEMERKVVKMFAGEAGAVDAILYKEVDSIGITLGYILHYVFSGQQLANRDMNALISHYRKD